MTTGLPPSAPDNPGAQQVSWWSVHEFVDAVLKQVNDWPMLGTPAWCSLAHDDPRRWAAILDGAQHHALRIETAQAARADASRAVAAAPDWRAVSRDVQHRAHFRASRPWAVRAPSN
ncbi:DUF2742 domain-containing protein [Mycobacterium barrassiae]|uniref:DUF2742 domain-containing protein n=1 Tax=Mycobacterium barrassiae TaxID=319709 RepID=UPI0022659BA6|nr:DUF2742 domain-containing protein [Mycobacterium barrassiae]MCV7300880.1 DUF2742 domain-containing protein [Mycobacterium barrassiae]